MPDTDREQLGRLVRQVWVRWASEQRRPKRSWLVGWEVIRAQKYARRRCLDPIPPWWADDRLAEFDSLCAYGCGREASTWDHVWPVSLGGRSHAANLVPACGSCNSRKGNGYPWPWVERGYAVFPQAWSDLIALGLEVRGVEWLEEPA
jgi:5-methylcytosine-specific restriction endonuclease McrA